MRVCLLYDCLYPYTVGGAEHWYRDLVERLAADGHEVTYLTLQQWPRRQPPEIPGVRVVAVAPGMELYVDGRRRIGPALRFALGALRHLLRHGDRYDAVHTGAGPFFPLLAASVARRRHQYRLVVDWFEVWTRAYWQQYLGPARGAVAWAIQHFCARRPHEAFCFSRLHERRLLEEGFRGRVVVLEGLYRAGAEPEPAQRPDPVVVFAGRHIPEKRAPALVEAVALARETVPDLRLEIYGDGPERGEVLHTIERLGLEGAAVAPGFVDADELSQAFARALCVALPSTREGYGLVVVEASARGTPALVVRSPDNAATELVEDGENGVVAPSPAPGDLAAAILRVHEEGARLRSSTAAWYERNAERLSLESSLDAVLAAYGDRR